MSIHFPRLPIKKLIEMSEMPTFRGEQNRRSKMVIGRNATWVVAQVITSTIVLFVVYYFAVRAVGVDQIGLLSILSTTAAAARVSELGLSGAVTRFLPEHLARGETTDAAQVVVTATVAVGFSVGLVAILAWPAFNALVPLIIDAGLVPEARAIIPVMLFSLWMNIVSGCVVMSLDGVNRADRRAKITVLSHIVFAVVAILTIGRLGIVGIPVAQAVQAACVFLLAILSLLRELPEMKSARPSFACFRRIWLYGAHLQLVALLVLLYDPATRLLLNYFGSLSAVGYFEMATRLIGQVRSLVVSANQVMVPHYANLNITNPETVARVVRANFQILLVVSTIVFSMLSVSSFLIGNLWIGQADAVFIEVYMILIIGYFANTLSAAIYFMNIGTGAALNNVTSWVVMISVNVIGGIFGGYLFGVIGVLVSVSTSLVCGSIVMFAAYSRKGNVRVGTWMSSITIRLAIAGCIVYLIAILYTVMGFPFLNGVATSFVPIGLGVLIWVLFGVGEALIVGQSPLLWVRAMIASLRLQ